MLMLCNVNPCSSERLDNTIPCRLQSTPRISREFRSIISGRLCRNNNFDRNSTEQEFSSQHHFLYVPPLNPRIAFLFYVVLGDKKPPDFLPPQTF